MIRATGLFVRIPRGAVQISKNTDAPIDSIGLIEHLLQQNFAESREGKRG